MHSFHSTFLRSVQKKSLFNIGECVHMYVCVESLRHWQTHQVLSSLYLPWSMESPVALGRGTLLVFLQRTSLGTHCCSLTDPAEKQWETLMHIYTIYTIFAFSVSPPLCICSTCISCRGTQKLVSLSHLVAFFISFHCCWWWLRLIDTSDIEGSCNTTQHSWIIVCCFESKLLWPFDLWNIKCQISFNPIMINKLCGLAEAPYGPNFVVEMSWKLLSLKHMGRVTFDTCDSDNQQYIDKTLKIIEI